MYICGIHLNDMKKHFELTEEFKITAFGVKLFRIKATRKSKHASKGALGGWVEKKENLSGDAWVSGNAQVYGDARVSGNAWVHGDARVYGDAWVYGDARVYGYNDFCYFQGFGSVGRATTMFKCEGGKIQVNCGCFSGDLDAFIKQVKDTHGESKYAREYIAMVELARIKFE